MNTECDHLEYSTWHGVLWSMASFELPNIPLGHFVCSWKPTFNSVSLIFVCSDQWCVLLGAHQVPLSGPRYHSK